MVTMPEMNIEQDIRALPDLLVHGTVESEPGAAAARFITACDLGPVGGPLRIEEHVRYVDGSAGYARLIADLDVEGAQKLQRTIAKFLASKTAVS